MTSNESDAQLPSADWPLADSDIREALFAAYQDGSWGQYHGPNCERLAEELQQHFVRDHAMLCCSGTLGIELALRACAIEPGDEVVLAGYDFPGNFRAIEAVGALPVLADVDPHSWCLDANQLADLHDENIKAIIVSHLHGGLADMPTITSIAQDRGWYVIEDACQQPGAVCGGRPVGSWGDLSVLSFGGSKLLTAGRGGAVMTDDPQLLQRMKIYSERGNQAFPMSELQATVLRPQLKKLSERNQIRSQAVSEILELPSPASEWLRPIRNQVEGLPAYYKFAWSLIPAESQIELREKLLVECEAQEVPIGAGFRGFVGRSDRRCKKVSNLVHSAQLSQSTVLLHHPILLAHKNAAQQVVQSLYGMVQQLMA